MFEAWSLMQNATSIIREMSMHVYFIIFFRSLFFVIYFFFASIIASQFAEPKAIIIAEDLKHNPALHYVAGFDAQWEDNFFYNMLDVVSSQQDSGVDLGKLRDALNGPEFLADLDRMHRVIFTENHDTIPINRCNRIPVAIASKAEPNGGWDGDGDNNAEHNVISLKRSTMAAAILFCAPGIPMILAGQELYEIYGSEWPIPPPIDWSRKKSYSGICQLYSDLIKLRKNSGHSTAGLTSPNFRIFHENHFEKVMAFHRYLRFACFSGCCCSSFCCRRCRCFCLVVVVFFPSSIANCCRFGPSDDTIVVVNASSNIKNGYRLGIPRPGRWFNRCNTDDQRYYAEFDGCLEESHFDVVDFPQNEPYDGFPFSIWFSNLPRYSVIILSQ
jgi:1,4-alpha-glucan branching enzyme